MITFHVRNVTEAWDVFRRYMCNGPTRTVAPRGSTTREISEPVATIYSHPTECVLLDPVRDCNPFFHLYESLWKLAGMRDVARVRFYNAQIEVYSDDAEVFHGAYGYRMREHFGLDQIAEVIALLRNDYDSRRAVISLWDPLADLPVVTSGRDVPCNTTVYCKIREGALNITVCNRSNDAVWGAYGSNAVQFSFLQQYIAAALGVAVGTYTQVSDSLHVYLTGKPGEVWARCAGNPALYNNYTPSVEYCPLVADPKRFMGELRVLLAPLDGTVAETFAYKEPFFQSTVPVFKAHRLYREVGAKAALEVLPFSNEAWTTAAREWLSRRVK